MILMTSSFIRGWKNSKFLQLWKKIMRDLLSVRYSLENFFLCRAHQLPQNRCMWSRTCVKILAYVTYMGKYQKTFIWCHTFYLVIFLIIFPCSFFFKYNKRLMFQKKLILKFHAKFLHGTSILVFIISYIFFKKFIEIHKVSQNKLLPKIPALEPLQLKQNN